MSDAAIAIVGALLGFIAAGVSFVAYSLSRTRERLARLEQHVIDRVNGQQHQERG